jgi:hypothetical protein
VRSVLLSAGGLCFARAMSKKKKGDNPSLRRRVMWPFVLVAVLTLAAISWWWRSRDSVSPVPASTPAAVAKQAPTADAAPLVDRCQRPDGGYVLEISGWKSGGKLEVSYLNPWPIHVGQAAWTQTSDGLNAVVELRDQGYPGATYALRFDASSDRLVGSYYQPAAGQAVSRSGIMT